MKSKKKPQRNLRPVASEQPAQPSATGTSVGKSSVPPRGGTLVERAFTRAEMPPPRELARCLAEQASLAESYASGKFQLDELPGREDMRVRVTVWCERVLKEDVAKAMIRSLLRVIEDEKEAAAAARILDPWLDKQQLPQRNELVATFLRKWGATLGELGARWIPFWLEDDASQTLALEGPPLRGAAGVVAEALALLACGGVSLGPDEPPTGATLTRSDQEGIEAAVRPALDWPSPVREQLVAQSLWKWAGGEAGRARAALRFVTASRV